VDELNARLESLFRRFAAMLDVDGAEDLFWREQFLEEARSLVAEFGVDAIEAAMDEPSPDDTPSIMPH
jgi:hypothetical protein